MRSFRLDRISGEVRTLAVAARTSRPAGLNMLDAGARRQPAGRSQRPGAGQRRPGRSAAPDGARPEPAGEGSVLTIDYRDLDRLAGVIAAAGTDALALEPPELVKAVTALLAAAAGRVSAGARHRRRRPPMSTDTGDKVSRLLALVPYVLAQGVASISETATTFGISEDQLRKELEMLWLCGRSSGPGGPDRSAVRGRHRVGHLRRWSAPATEADRDRGDDAGGRAAHADRRARRHPGRRGRAGAGQDRDRGRPAPGHHRGRHPAGLAGSLAEPGAAGGHRAAGGPAELLHRHPGHLRRSG